MTEPPEAPRARDVGRRKTDRLAAEALVEGVVERRRLRLRENWYRDLWLLLLTIVLVGLSLNASGDAGEALSKAERQQEGRAVAVDVVCGGLSAVIESGRAAFTAGGQLPPRLTDFLERHGYPPAAVREAAARKAAVDYAEGIAKAVERESGLSGLVRRDGSLNCQALRKAAAATRPSNTPAPDPSTLRP